MHPLRMPCISYLYLENVKNVFSLEFNHHLCDIVNFIFQDGRVNEEMLQVNDSYSI